MREFNWGSGRPVAVLLLLLLAGTVAVGTRSGLAASPPLIATLCDRWDDEETAELLRERCDALIFLLGEWLPVFCCCWGVC